MEDQTYTLHTRAQYQARNAAVALTCLRALKQQGELTLSEEALREGLRKAVWAGRFEVLQEHPLTIIDGAHNAPGIQALCTSVQDLPHPRVIVFTALKDKETEVMARQLKQISDSLIITVRSW